MTELFRRYKRIISLILIIVLFASFAHLANAAQIPVSAKSAFLLDVESNTVLFEKSADVKLPMASLTKIMTSVVVLETMNLGSIITVKKEDILVEGSSMYLTESEQISVGDLLTGLLLTSGNDAANVLASAYPGGSDAFIDKMNAKAFELGLTSTCFANPSGLTADNHYSTARELAILTAYALSNEVFSDTVALKSAKVGSRTLVNHNKMLSYYDGAIGVKTGYTKLAGRCLVSAAKVGDALLVCVTLNAPDDWNDHIKLFNFGFNSFERITYEDLIFDTEIRIGGGVKDTLLVGVNKGKYTFKKGVDNTSVEVLRCPYVLAPISIGQVIGTVKITLSNGEILTLPLTAKEGVAARRKPGIFDWLKKLFKRK